MICLIWLFFSGYRMLLHKLETHLHFSFTTVYTSTLIFPLLKKIPKKNHGKKSYYYPHPVHGSSSGNLQLSESEPLHIRPVFLTYNASQFKVTQNRFNNRFQSLQRFQMHISIILFTITVLIPASCNLPHETFLQSSFFSMARLLRIRCK